MAGTCANFSRKASHQVGRAVFYRDSSPHPSGLRACCTGSAGREWGRASTVRIEFTA
ncbi:MAG: hypothetical protein KJ729_01500 [Euryarchaeota archaeon]|nr:hypothetical protein [Euryarchaeota archaeon]